MTMTKAKRAERDEALERLREILKPGDTVHTILRHVSRSGMLRRIDLVKLADGEHLYLTGYASTVFGDRTHAYPGDGLKMTGAGMDMGFEAVYRLSWHLFGRDGYACVGEGSGPHGRGNLDSCPSPEHSYGRAAFNTYGPDIIHKDGYALSHRWL